MRLLVIEDFSPLRRSIEECLTESGYVVDSTGSGEEGLWYADNHHYDLIILDLMLPQVDGLAILKHIRDKNCITPVIITSARDTVDQRIEGLDAGANDYLIKPFDLNELLARIRANFRTQYEKPNNTITIGKLEISLQHKSVSWNGETIDLTRREYQLLEYLAYRKGEVVSRTDIWHHVYADYEGGSSNVVDVYIGYLRKKLKPYQADQYLATRRGLGYILTDPESSNE